MTAPANLHRNPDLADPRATDHSHRFQGAQNEVPLVLNFGAGVDSHAVAAGFKALGIRPDLVIFADTGSERAEVYRQVERFKGWLAANGWPELTIVTRNGELDVRASTPYRTLEGNCLHNWTLPSLAYGGKSCSLKWKADPMDRFIWGTRTGKASGERQGTGWKVAQEAAQAGQRIVKAIGYDCSPADSRRAVGKEEDPNYATDYWYPLRNWGWDREACEAACLAEYGYVPAKSACYFCPASQPWEMERLARTEPELFLQALRLERRGMYRAKAKERKGKATSTEGLGRSTTKARPGSWRQWANQTGWGRKAAQAVRERREALSLARAGQDTTLAWAV